MLTEGYVLHTYGPARYVQHAVASVLTLRRHDRARPVALYCPPEHRDHLEQYGLCDLFDEVRPLPEAHRSIVGFKHHLHRFMPFDRCLFADADMVWCRDPSPLWQQLGAYAFTATGLEQADVFFGAAKGLRVLSDVLANRRRRTMQRFGLTHLPRVQAGMIYAADATLARAVCEQAAAFLARRDETHFRSRLDEGRSEETCEWSLAVAMSRLDLPVLPWLQAQRSPQLDFVEGWTDYDEGFEHVTCRYYCDRFAYSLRGLRDARVRDGLLALITRLPGRGDYLDVTPFALHFGWLHQKEPFYRFSEQVWAEQVQRVPTVPRRASGAVTGA